MNQEKGTPTCPHCRYDLSGHDALVEADGEGVKVFDCPECGRSFRWPRVGRPPIVPKVTNTKLDRVILWSLFIVLISILAYGAFERWLAQLG